MATTITVPYAIGIQALGGLVEGYAKNQGAWAVVKFYCATSDRYTLTNELLGTATVSGSPSPGNIVREYPFQYPPSPNLICTSVESIEQYGGGSPLISSGFPWIGRMYSIVTARFEYAVFFPDNSDPSGVPYTTTTLNMSSESFTAPFSTYTFPSGAPTSTPLSIQVPSIQIECARWFVPYLPDQAMFACVGKVNQFPFTIGSQTFPPGYVLFTGGPAEILPNPNGEVVYKCTYNFNARAYSWNAALSPDPTEGWAIPIDGNGDPLYSSADFSQLP
jgi:hypothetical protein